MWCAESGLESGVSGYLVAWLLAWFGIGRGKAVEEGEVGTLIGDGEVHCWNGYPAERDAGLPVTQPNDPPDLVISGGHFSIGTLKTPLRPTVSSVKLILQRWVAMTHLCPARESGTVIVQVGLSAFDAADCEHTGSSVGPHHSNAPTVSVAGNRSHISPRANCERTMNEGRTRGKD